MNIVLIFLKTTKNLLMEWCDEGANKSTTI